MDSLEDEKIGELAEFIAKKAVNQAGFTRSDMDELVLRTEASKNSLPERFLKVVKNFDDDFSTFADERGEFLDRLSRIIKISKTLQDSPTNALSSELIPEFSISDDEKTRVFKLCSAMRKIVFSSSIFDAPHRRRLLNRIAAIEHEVHQKQGKLDVILAGVVDVGDALGKFGDKIEPLTKRMKEVAQIARSGSKEYGKYQHPMKLRHYRHLKTLMNHNSGLFTSTSNARDPVPGRAQLPPRGGRISCPLSSANPSGFKRSPGPFARQPPARGRALP